jgi:hypothetical protein
MTLPLVDGVVLQARSVVWDDDQGFVPVGQWVDGLSIEGELRTICDGYATLHAESATPDGACDKLYCQRSRL